MGKPGYLQKVGKGLGLRIEYHLYGIIGAEFRQPERAYFAPDLLRSDTERLCGGKKLDNVFVVHRDGANVDPRKLLQYAVKCRHIVAEDIQLQKRIMKIFKSEMRCYNAAFRLVCRILHGGKIVNLVFLRDNDYTARMLARCSADADKAVSKPCLLRPGEAFALILQKLLYKAVAVFILQCRNRAGAEYIFRAEKNFRIFMRFGLDIAGKVQVDIRISCPSGRIGVPHSGQGLSSRSNPLPTEPSVINSEYLQFGQT